MEIGTFIKDCKNQGIFLYLKNGELAYRAKKGALKKEILESIKNRKNNILKHLEREGKPSLRFQITPALKNQAILFNRFLWTDYSNRLMEVSSANAAHIVVRRKGRILPDALVKGIHVLLDRHKILNSNIVMAEGNLYLRYLYEKIPAFQEIVVKGETFEQQEQEAMRIANDLIWKEYDLDDGPLYRIFLIRISENDFILGAGLHHAIGDGISIEILFQELGALYSSIRMDASIQLTPVKFHYLDYLASMETWSKNPTCSEHMKYWKDTLRSTPFTGLIPEKNLPRNRSHTDVSAEVKIVFNSDLSCGLKNAATQLKKTLFCVLLACHKIALWKMTRQEELVIISLQAGRINPDFKTMIGNISMEVAYSTSLAGDPSFVEVTERITHTMNEAQIHQPILLDWVRQALLNDGIYFNAPGMSLLPERSDELQVTSGTRRLKFHSPDVPHGCHGFPTSYAVEFRDGPRVIEGSMIYRKDLYDIPTIHTFVKNFQKTVSDAVKDPEKKLNDFL